MKYINLTDRMSFGDEGFFQDLYEEWIDMINENVPLRPDVLSLEVESALNVNQQIITHMHNIRRHLELDDFDPIPSVSSIFQSSTVNPQPLLRYDIDTLENLLGMQITGNRNSITIGNSLASEMFQGVINLLVNNEYTPTDTLDDVKVVLTTDEFNKLDQLEVSKEKLQDYINKECNVCIESYKEHEKVTRLPCQHIFHEECIKNWLCNENVKCPVCRSDTRQFDKTK